MSKEFELVIKFNEQILNIQKRKVKIQKKDEYLLSYMQLKEEAEEFLLSCKNNDVIGCVDACFDSIYFSMGILYKLGIMPKNYVKIFEIIHKANMTKKLGKKENRSNFESADAVKTNTFISPEVQIREILKISENDKGDK
jgi:predicted HAD superfamily Cof-like phosphohydrolase